MDNDDKVTRASMYLGAVGSAPMPVEEAASQLVGNKLSEEAIGEVARAAHKIAQPMDNTDFAASWRGKMAEQYAIAALRDIAGLPQERMRPRHMLKVV
jgi:CO/xanthine dehydrogenase FAD-binding subunit